MTDEYREEENNVGISFKKSYEELEKENELLKISNNALTIQYEQDIAELEAQITYVKEDVKRERNKQRRLKHDFIADILNNLLNKWS